MDPISENPIPPKSNLHTKTFALVLATSLVSFGLGYAVQNYSPKKPVEMVARPLSTPDTSPTPSSNERFVDVSDRYFEKSGLLVEICAPIPVLWDAVPSKYAEGQCLQFSDSGDIFRFVDGSYISTYTPDDKYRDKILEEIYPLYNELNSSEFKEYLLSQPQALPLMGSGGATISLYSKSKEVKYPSTQELKTTFQIGSFDKDTRPTTKRLEEIFEKLRSYGSLINTITPGPSNQTPQETT